MVKGKKAVSSYMVALILVAVTILILWPFLSKTREQANKTLSIVPETPGVIKEGEAEQYQSDAEHLTIRKVTECGSTTPIRNTPSSFEPGNWVASEVTVSDSTLCVTIHFDKELEMTSIPDHYYTVHTNHDWTGLPSKPDQWDLGPDPGFQRVDAKQDKFKTTAGVKNGYYYIIRFHLDKQYKDKEGKEWEINPRTATVKFEVR